MIINCTNYMEYFDFSKSKLEEIRKKSILECSNWWGHRSPGYRGTIITEDNEMYSYNYYINEFKDKKTNYIVKNKELNKRECKKVKKFIENEILNHKFNSHNIKDAGFTVIVNYNGEQMTIINNTGNGKKLLIYDKTEKLMENILNSKENIIIRFLTKLKKKVSITK